MHRTTTPETNTISNRMETDYKVVQLDRGSFLQRCLYLDAYDSKWSREHRPPGVYCCDAAKSTSGILINDIMDPAVFE